MIVELSADGIEIDEPLILHRWNGKHLKFDYDFFVPMDYKRKKIFFKANIYFDEQIICLIRLKNSEPYAILYT